MAIAYHEVYFSNFIDTMVSLAVYQGFEQFTGLMKSRSKEKPGRKSKLLKGYTRNHKVGRGIECMVQ